jgi:putative phosphoribosyl transferase
VLARELVAALRPYRDAAPVVVGLPRRGLPLAYEVARALDAPLDVWIVQRLDAPLQPGRGIGTLDEDGTITVERDAIDDIGIRDEQLTALLAATRKELIERVRRIRCRAAAVDVRGETVIAVDDGIATGRTARAALRALRARGAERIVLAAALAPSVTLAGLEPLADAIVCPQVGLGDDGAAPTDDDVVALLDRARTERASLAQASRRRIAWTASRWRASRTSERATR